MSQFFRTYGQLFAAILLLSIPILVALVVSKIGGPYSWDDGSISLAFGQTLFETGNFSLNAASPRVEGSSSILYTILTGAVIHGLGLEFNAAIEASRIIAAFFFSATCIFLFGVLQQYLSAKHAFLTALIYAVLPVNYLEVYNGMEMLAFGFLLVLYFHLLQKNAVMAFAVLPFAILIRIEAGFYILVVLFLACWFSQGAARSRYLRHIIATVIMLAALEAFRVVYFGSILPNTVLAKMHYPYSEEGFDGFVLKLAGLFDFLKFYIVPVILLLTLFFRTPWKLLIKPEHLLIPAFGLFALLAGRNWGYDARMTLGLLPPTLVAVAASGHALRTVSVAGRTFLSPLLLVLLTIFGHTIASTKTVEVFVRQLLSGESYVALAEKNVSNLNPSAPYAYGWYGITPENYRITGKTVENLAEILNLPRIAFATPDVGGLGLCCKAIEVVDTALLTNPDLTAIGYAHFDTYITDIRPDLIETHGIWSEVTAIYSGAYFQQNYTPLVFHNTLFYLRNDHTMTLLSANKASITSVEAFNWNTVRYGTSVQEKGYLASVGQVIRLP